MDNRISLLCFSVQLSALPSFESNEVANCSIKLNSVEREMIFTRLSSNKHSSSIVRAYCSNRSVCARFFEWLTYSNYLWVKDTRVNSEGEHSIPVIELNQWAFGKKKYSNIKKKVECKEEVFPVHSLDSIEKRKYQVLLLVVCKFDLRRPNTIPMPIMKLQSRDVKHSPSSF